MQREAAALGYRLEPVQSEVEALRARAGKLGLKLLPLKLPSLTALSTTAAARAKWTALAPVAVLPASPLPAKDDMVCWGVEAQYAPV